MVHHVAEEGLSHALISALEANGISTVQATNQDWVLALDRCEIEAQLAFRRAAEAAIAIDGLIDRAAEETLRTKKQIRSEISAICVWPKSSLAREGALDRIRAAANAYKHRTLDDPTLPIKSEDDILVVGAPYGTDVFGGGKYGGAEVLVREPGTGTVWKFLVDCPVVIGAWLSFLRHHGAALGAGPFLVCGLEV